MKVLVAVKRVVDPYVKIHVKKDESGIETSGVKMSMNPFDEIAMEEALRFKEKGWANEVIVFSMGEEKAQETIRAGLAFGADRGIFLNAPTPCEPLNVAYGLEAIVARESPQVVLLGKQAIDDDCNQVGQMLAGLLNWPMATFASKIEWDQNTHFTVTREVDGGLETLSLNAPCVLTTDLRLNEPRHLSLPNIVKAKRKPLESLSLDDLGLQLSAHCKTLSVKAPPRRQAGKRVSDVDELMDILRNQEKVI